MATPVAPSDAAVTGERKALQRWRLEQQQYYQLRSTFLSEALAARLQEQMSLKPSTGGSSGSGGGSGSGTAPFLPTMLSVSTVEGDRPQPTDWDCAISTEDDPKTCLYSFDAPPGAKVVAPIHTDQWITLHSLNRLRRLDPTKVEPMWHRKYSILTSWFGESETSLLQHVGIKGWLVSNLLLDHRWILRTLLGLTIVSLAIAFLPVWDYALNSLLISEFFWGKYNQWGRIVHTALPFKLLVAQMVWKFISGRLDKLERKVRDRIVEAECQILEETVPVTVGLGSDDELDDDEEALGFDENDDEVDDTTSLEEEESDLLVEEDDFQDLLRSRRGLVRSTSLCCS